MWVDMFPKDMPLPTITLDISPRKPERLVTLFQMSQEQCSNTHCFFFLQSAKLSNDLIDLVMS